MTLSSSVLNALKTLKPDSLNTSSFSFFEFLKYETDDLRNERVIAKDDLINRYKNSDRQKDIVISNTINDDFNDFSKILSDLRLADDAGDSLEYVKWEKITDICNILRKIESSDEKKARWAILYLLSQGGKEIEINQIKLLLKNFDIPNIERTLQKIIKTETESGLTATFDGKKLVLDTEQKLAERYIADAIEEKSRRSPGEIEDEVLELLDEGSYSNQEISRILDLDEAVVSRVMTKLRNHNKLVLSSFGNKGFRYYTTNCQNCPFGKTSSSCRKDAISYIVTAFKEAYGLELTSLDFEEIETNQALLSMKRITTMSKKYSMTKLESNMYENYEKLLQRVVKNSLEIKDDNHKKSKDIPTSSHLLKLPKIFQLGLKAGIEHEIRLLKNLANESKDDTSLAVLSKAIKDSNKILKSFEE